MGLNFYLVDNTDRCQHCGRGGEEKHIGKSSGGWCFSLHVIPEEGINSLDDWKELFEEEETSIEDEFGNKFNSSEMLDQITNRSFTRWEPITEEMLRDNEAERGPNGLMRPIVDGVYCVGHGDGTWDLIEGEFS